MRPFLSSLQRSWASALAGLLWLAAVFLLAPGAMAAPDSKLWDRWAPHADAQQMEVDHRPWQAFLDSYRRVAPDGIARVAYGEVSPSDHQALDIYLKGLQALPVARLTLAQQFAYWVNLYNAQTVALVLEAYPVSSIRQVQGGVLRTGPWRKKRLRVDGEPVSLDDIEHRILRPIWRDPRVHYALNCAALGCPDLAPEAFTQLNTERLLTAQARLFVNHPRGLRRDEKGRLVGSSIYDWFAQDFGGPGQVVAHIRGYASNGTLDIIGTSTKLDRHSYEWGLNDAAN